MSTTLSWQEIALRLALTLFAGAVIGSDRGTHGRAAGLRTTMLVCLAASIAMIQTNLLMGTTGKSQDSFITIDLMRLPLGILSGMGFIGGGVILKRDDLVLGVTTAATLWFVTVLGLCFGGGQHQLGLAALVLGLLVLKLLKRLEEWLPQDQRATVVLTTNLEGPDEAEVRRLATGLGFRVAQLGLAYDNTQQSRQFTCELLWRAAPHNVQHPGLVQTLARLPGVLRVELDPCGRPTRSD